VRGIEPAVGSTNRSPLSLTRQENWQKKEDK